MLGGVALQAAASTVSQFIGSRVLGKVNLCQVEHFAVLSSDFSPSRRRAHIWHQCCAFTDHGTCLPYAGE